mgnify:CR=1 FL=1
MKITKTKLKQIIKEELANSLSEGHEQFGSMLDTAIKDRSPYERPDTEPMGAGATSMDGEFVADLPAGFPMGAGEKASAYFSRLEDAGISGYLSAGLYYDAQQGLKPIGEGESVSPDRPNPFAGGRDGF